MIAIDIEKRNNEDKKTWNSILINKNMDIWTQQCVNLYGLPSGKRTQFV